MGNCHLDEQCYIFGPDAICNNNKYMYAMKIFPIMWRVNSFAEEIRESAKLVNKIETVM